MTPPGRGRTISSSGEIVERPYGPGRWHSPRSYGCAHPGCPRPATVLARAGAHPGTDPAADHSLVERAHNCCGHPEHDVDA